MRNYSRFIPGEEIDAVQHWQFGAIDTAAQLLATQARAREAEQGEVQLEAARQDSFRAGYAEGVAQGKIQAQAELQQQMSGFMAGQAQEAAQRFGDLLVSTQSQLSQAKQVMAEGVLELSCEIARQVLRQELSVNPNVLMPVIRESLDLLGAEHRSAVVRLNPQDLEVLEGLVSSEFSGMVLSLRADAGLQPGGCVVESAGMVVDASLQKRWRRAVATLGLANAWEDFGEPS
jgi:flagellar assembly protein FliH